MMRAHHGQYTPAWQALIALLVVWCVATLVPPIQSPDELSHVARADMLSRGQWVLSTPAGKSTGGLTDHKLVEFFVLHSHLIKAPARTSITDEQKRALVGEIHWSDQLEFFEVPGTGYYNPLIYLPSATGLWVGRHLGLNVITSYWMARAMVWLVCALLLAAALRRLQPTPMVWMLLALPMSLFQFTAPVIDGLCASLTLAVVALSFELTQPDRPAPSLRHWLVLAIGITLLVTARVHMIALLALPFLLAWQRRRLVMGGAWGLLTTALTAGWLWHAMASTVDTRVTRSVGTGPLVQHFLAHPLELAQVFLNTLSDPARREFYGHSFIGILGWLDTPLPGWSYPVLLGGLLAGCLAAPRRRNEASPEAAVLQWWVGASALCAAFLVFLAMLLTWTPWPAAQIEGVQGRYFLLPTLLLACALAGPRTAYASTRWRDTWMPVAFLALSLVAMVPTLWVRYH